MNNNKESDKTYIVVWCTTNKKSELNPEVTTNNYQVCESLDYAQKLYAQLIESEYCYSANITQVIESTDYHQTRAAKIVDEPKKITNDFDHWIKELDTTAQHMADWLSNNTENFEEEYLIDNARTSVEEAVQSIQENKTKNVTALPTANCVTAVLDYILYSEMGGKYDANDSWHSTYQLLMELRNDKIDPDDLSYVSDLKPLH
jgi:hypothetical protein